MHVTLRVSLVVSGLVLAGACGGATPAKRPPDPAPAAVTSVASAAAGLPDQGPEAPEGLRTSKYVVLTAGRPAGGAEQTVAADGTRRSRFWFNDRGRGPDLKTELVLDARGLPRSVTTQGHDYWKAPVDERTLTEGGELRWTSSSERGAAPAGAGFFVPLSGPFDSLALVARAVEAAPGQRLPLLPAGEVWLESSSAHQVTVGGVPRTVRQLALAGIGFAPELFWVDEQGELFAALSPWSSLVVAGAEPLVGQLTALDAGWRKARAAKLAAELAEAPPAAGLAFTNVRLYDSERRRVQPNATVVLQGDRIIAVGGPRTKVPAGARVIDGAGKTLLPGLWDMHVHQLDGDGLLQLAMGITTVRDLGNEVEELGRRIGRFEDGTELGPRVLRAGLIDGPGELAAPTGALAATAAEAEAHVARFADLGYQQIKLYSSLDPALVPVIVKAAHARGLRVSGHIPNGMIAAQAVEAGYDEIQHANMLFLNFLLEPGDDTRGPARFVRVAEKGAALDLDSAQVRAFLDLLVRKKTVLDPTLATFESMFASEPSDPMPMMVPYFGRLPAQVQRGSLGGGLAAPDGKRASFRAAHAAMGQLVRRAWQRGIPVVAGTDAIAGLSLARELELYVAAGIPAKEVLSLATLGAARVMGLQKVSGSIAVGKRADLVLVEGDPLVDLGAVRNPVTVVARGRLYDAARLWRAAGMRPLAASR